MLYLTLLSYAAELRAALPPPPPPPESDLYIPPGWSWPRAVASLLPWNLPIVGAVIQGAIAALMLRWAPWLPIGTTTEEPVGPAPKRPPVVQWAPWVLAAVIPLVTVASMGRGDLAGKTCWFHKGTSTGSNRSSISMASIRPRMACCRRSSKASAAGGSIRRVD